MAISNDSTTHNILLHNLQAQARRYKISENDRKMKNKWHNLLNLFYCTHIVLLKANAVP
jgi:hypothetical protein